MNWTPRKTALIRKTFHEWLRLPGPCKSLPGEMCLTMSKDTQYCETHSVSKTILFGYNFGNPWGGIYY